MKRFLRFLVVGVVNTTFGYGIFTIVFLFTGIPALALFVAIVLGVAFNYFTTGNFVFARRGNHQAGLFILGYSFVYFANLAALHLLIASGVGPILSQLICLPCLAVLSYFINARFVFRKQQ